MTGARLPELDWLATPQLQRVVAALSDGEDRPRLVGGAVRDGLLALPVTDIDLATPILPENATMRLEQAGIKAVPTGIDHGTITAVLDGKSFEITTLRRDVATDGRRAVVAYSDDWREDAARRDFTMNALYADPVSREIFDYFGGLEDLKNRQLRFIGKAADRIAEDHLRILRYFRFLARYGGNVADAEAIAACKGASASLMALSRERIASELIKIVCAARPLRAVQLMIENQIFAPFLPELSESASAALDRLLVREAQFAVAALPPARLLTLLPASAPSADKVAMRLKLSNKTRKDLAARLKQTKIGADNVRAMAYAHGIDAARDAALLFAPDGEITECLQKLTDWQVPKFEVKGGDLISRGLIAGPIVARTLRAIEQAWVESGFVSDKPLAALVDKHVTSALAKSSG